MKFTKILITLVIFCAGFNTVFAQRSDTAYVKTIQERSWKIVQQLNVADQAKALKVRDIIANQYMDLNDVYIYRDTQKKQIETSGLDKAQKQAKLDALTKDVDSKISKLHNTYIKNLSKNLSDEQVVGVKDGMTYSVVPKTFRAYQDMLPMLTQAQKDQIYVWLVEAREHAMDAESSDKKHAWFGKYKGRINNYLSAAGIDLKKEGDAWQERIKAGKTK